MKARTFGLIGLLVAWVVVLPGCNNNPSSEEVLNEEVVNEEVVNEAREYCIDNGWTHEIVTSDTAVYGECTLPDGTVCEEWEYFNGECPANLVNEYTLTNEDLDAIDEKNFPTSYTYETYNMVTEGFLGSWEFVYPEDFSHTILIPIHATMANREIISSGIQDGMIYVDTKVTLQDDTEVNVLYVVNPDTMQYVAANVENWDITTNYQFSY